MAKEHAVNTRVALKHVFAKCVTGQYGRYSGKQPLCEYVVSGICVCKMCIRVIWAL